MPRMRRPHGENGDIPLPRKRESLPGRLLLRRSFTPLALQLNLNLPPGGRRATSVALRGTFLILIRDEGKECPPAAGKSVPRNLRWHQ